MEPFVLKSKQLESTNKPLGAPPSTGLGALLNSSPRVQALAQTKSDLNRGSGLKPVIQRKVKKIGESEWTSTRTGKTYSSYEEARQEDRAERDQDRAWKAWGLGPDPKQVSTSSALVGSSEPMDDRIASVKNYNVDPSATTQDRISERQENAQLMGIDSAKDFLSGKASLEGWNNTSSGDKTESIAGSHHKFPKRQLGYLHEHMTPQQKLDLNSSLGLVPDAGPKALARLRSNLIPPGPNEVSPDIRSDDPEHTGEGLDLVTNTSGSLTPRSRSYANLAVHSLDINQDLRSRSAESGVEETLLPEQFDLVKSHLLEAESAHFAIEGSSEKLAKYPPDFWRRDRNNVTRPFSKGTAPVPDITPTPELTEDYQAHRREVLERQRQEAADKFRQERQEKELAEQQRRAEQQAKRDADRDKRVHGHSASFW